MSRVPNQIIFGMEKTKMHIHYNINKCIKVKRQDHLISPI